LQPLVEFVPRDDLGSRVQKQSLTVMWLAGAWSAAANYPKVKEKGAVTSDQTIPQNQAHTHIGPTAAQIFDASDRINQLLIGHLDPAAWRAKPPGQTRNLGAIFTLLHQVRCKWVRLTAPHRKVPDQLNRARCTPQQASAALAASAAVCSEMLAEALGGSAGRIDQFRRDGWAKP
jgi:hypothetical protein